MPRVPVHVNAATLSVHVHVARVSVHKKETRISAHVKAYRALVHVNTAWVLMHVHVAWVLVRCMNATCKHVNTAPVSAIHERHTHTRERGLNISALYEGRDSSVVNVWIVVVVYDSLSEADNLWPYSRASQRSFVNFTSFPTETPFRKAHV